MAKNDLVCAKNGISIVVCSTKDCADRNPMILLIISNRAQLSSKTIKQMYKVKSYLLLLDTSECLFYAIIIIF